MNWSALLDVTACRHVQACTLLAIADKPHNAIAQLESLLHDAMIAD